MSNKPQSIKSSERAGLILRWPKLRLVLPMAGLFKQMMQMTLFKVKATGRKQSGLSLTPAILDLWDKAFCR